MATNNNAGRPAADPTRNVLDLVEAAIQRQDDLRTAESKHSREVAELRAEHIEAIALCRWGASSELRDIETRRIDAIRAVDVDAVQRAAGVASATAQTLAGQVAASAEAMRAQVAATATTSATALSQALVPIQKSIDDLRRAQYEAQGSKTQTEESGVSGRSMAGLWIAAAIGIGGLSVSLAGIAVALLVR